MVNQRRGKISRPLLEQRIRQALADGYTLTKIGPAVGLSKSQVHRIAVMRSMTRRRRNLSPAVRGKLKQLLAEGKLSLSQVARASGASKATVSRLAASKLARQDGESHRLRRAVRCRRCGRKTMLWPCAMCRDA